MKAPPNSPARGNRCKTGMEVIAVRSDVAKRRTPTGYILLELVIALSIFAIAVLGLANSLSASLEVANILNRENAVQIGLRSFIEELKKKPLADMSTTVTDATTGVTYTSKMVPVSIRTSRGSNLQDLYDLQVTALYTFGGEERTETVSVYVYKPNQR